MKKSYLDKNLILKTSKMSSIILANDQLAKLIRKKIRNY